MKLNIYYDETKKMCYLYEGDEFELDGSDYATIDVENHNTKNLHDFLQRKLIEALLSNNGEKMYLVTNNIINESFYTEDSFSKLIELINNLISICNYTISSCFKSLEDVNDNKLTDDMSK